MHQSSTVGLVMDAVGVLRSRVAGLLAAAVLVLFSAAFVVPDGHAIVAGGIIPCSGSGEVPNGTRYAGGVVSALKGQVIWRTTPNGNLGNVLPTDLVAQQFVPTNGNYRFVLEPGSYVLQAGISYTVVTLQPGDDMYLDIPNMCL
jgi:hypothetical protein